MRKQTPKLEWRFSESDAEWAAQQALLLPEVTAEVSGRLRLKQYVGIVMTTLLFFTSVAGWWRYSTQAKVHATETELRAAVAQTPLGMVTPDADALTTAINHVRRDGEWSRQHAWEYSAFPAPNQPNEPTVSSDAVVQTMEFLGEQAIADVVMLDERGAPRFRQTRFYQHVSTGWQLISPTATLWGTESTLETPYFVYHFGANDEATILAVAPQMDALYTTLWRNFGLPIDPPPAKLVIDVRVTQRPGRATLFDAANHISVASPAVYLAPVELTDVELLAQSIALPLLSHVVAQARSQHTIGQRWQPLLDGLYLWQMWDIELPLAAWRAAVVPWLYGDFPANRPGQPVVLPKHYGELCATHKLWMSSPAEIKIPLVCGELAWEDFLLSPWRRYDPLTHLAQLVVPLRPGEYLEEPDLLRRTPHPGETVALATLIEYAVATYGRERLPVLVADLGQYDRGATLIPAVYGVSDAEFEAGWQGYLAAHYGVAVKLPANP